MNGNRLSGERHNTLTTVIAGRSRRRVNMLVKELTAAGPPPGTVQSTSEVDQYHRLVAARDTGDPRYWENPLAQARLQELANKYGQPGPVQLNPWQEGSPTPATDLRATNAYEMAAKFAPPPQ